jgi:hypothetical protein
MYIVGALEREQLRPAPLKLFFKNLLFFNVKV